MRKEGSKRLSLIISWEVQQFSQWGATFRCYIANLVQSLCQKFRCSWEHIHDTRAPSRKMHQRCQPQDISSYGCHFTEHIEIKYTLNFSIAWIRHRTIEIPLARSEVWVFSVERIKFDTVSKDWHGAHINSECEHSDDTCSLMWMAWNVTPEPLCILFVVFENYPS